MGTAAGEGGVSYDDAYDRALDAGLCETAAADFAYDTWRFGGGAHAPTHYQHEGYPLRAAVSDEWLHDEYGWRCRPPRTGGGA